MKKGLFFYFQLTITFLTCVFLIAPVIFTVAIGLMKNAFKGFRSGLTLIGWPRF